MITNTSKSIGFECPMVPSVLELKANVTDGQYQEHVLKAYTESEMNNINMTLTIRPPQGSELGMRPNEAFGLASAAFTLTQPVNTFGSVFTGTVESGDGGTSYEFTGGDEIEAISYANFKSSACGDKKIVCSFKALARALTKGFVDAPFLDNGTDHPEGHCLW
jgi:hypothetical protein